MCLWTRPGATSGGGTETHPTQADVRGPGPHAAWCEAPSWLQCRSDEAWPFVRKSGAIPPLSSRTCTWPPRTPFHNTHSVLLSRPRARCIALVASNTSPPPISSHGAAYRATCGCKPAPACLPAPGCRLATPLRPRYVIAAGDPLQLPPLVASPAHITPAPSDAASGAGDWDDNAGAVAATGPAEAGLVRPLFVRLAQLGYCTHLLRWQYRWVRGASPEILSPHKRRHYGICIYTTSAGVLVACTV